MDSKKALCFLEWLVVGLMIGAIMLFGRMRMHQMSINKFLVLGYMVILLLMVGFYRVNKRISAPRR